IYSRAKIYMLSEIERYKERHTGDFKSAALDIKPRLIELDHLKKEMQMVSNKVLAKGYQYAKEDLGRVFSERKLNNIYVLEKEISDMNEKLLNDISNAFKMDVENAESLDDLSLTCRFLFESNQYKVKANARSTLYRAYNYGKVLAYIDAGEDKIMVQPESDCNECKEKSK